MPPRGSSRGTAAGPPGSSTAVTCVTLRPVADHRRLRNAISATTACAGDAGGRGRPGLSARGADRPAADLALVEYAVPKPRLGMGDRREMVTRLVQECTDP